MENFLFILKTLAITLLIVFFMQIEVGSDTLEDKAIFLLQDSHVVQPLRKVSEGAILVTKQSYAYIKSQFKQTVRTATVDDSKSNRKSE